jgi:hypothetical protein
MVKRTMKRAGKRPQRRITNKQRQIRRGLNSFFNPQSSIGLPDGGTFPSQHFCSTSRYTLTTDAVYGAAATTIPLGSLNLSHNEADSFSDANNVLLYKTPKAVPEYASLNASFARYRVVSTHVSIHYIHSSLENQGLVAIKLFNPTENNSFFAPLGYEETAPVQEYSTAKSSFSLVPLPIDDQYRQYATIKNAADNIDDFAVNAWPSVFVFYTGCAKGVAIAEIIVTRKLELLAEPGDFASRMAKLPPTLDHGKLELIAATRHSIAARGETVKATNGSQPATASLMDHVSKHVGTVAAAAGKTIGEKVLGWAEEAYADVEIGEAIGGLFA